MRTVSFFGPKEGRVGGGPPEPDNGRDAAGGFGGGKKLVDEISSGADCGEEGTGGLPVSRTGNWIRIVSRGFTVCCGGFGGGGTGGWIRTVSRGFTVCCGGFGGDGTGDWMRTVSFFGWSGSAITVGEIDQKSRTCHYQSWSLGKCGLR